MADEGDEDCGKRRSGGRPTDLAMGHYVKRLSEGCNYQQAAEGTDHDYRAFYEERRRNPDFAAACVEAIEQSAGMRFIAGGRGRSLQLRRSRCIRFTPERQAIYLSWFAATGNTEESADKAGVCASTVRKHRQNHPEFARACREALAEAYLKLDSQLLAGRIEAQRRLLEVEPADEPGPEFDRALKLLQRWDRNRSGGRRGSRPTEERWDFADAITLLERRLRNMGIPIEPLPPGYERPDGDLPLLAPPARAKDGGDGDRVEGEDGQEGDEEEGGE